MCRINLLLCVLPLLFSSRLTDGNTIKKSIVSKVWWTCKNIKCPPVEDPKCVKLKYTNLEETRKSAYIYVINKCELEYMKCHQDAEAIIVPNKYCDHSSISNSTKAKRLKRAIKKEVKSIAAVGKKQPSLVNKKALRSGDDGSDGTHGSDSGNGGHSGDGGHSVVGSDGGDSGNGGHSGDGSPSGPNSDERPMYDRENSIESDGSNIGKRFSDGDDNKNNDIECPTSCEIRGVMVCAKCLHGVYRTFLSPCHMRMFLCSNEDESLELMSRYPCVLSVPYALPIQGQLKEPHDDDDVLRFLWCREQEEFGSKQITKPVPYALPIGGQLKQPHDDDDVLRFLWCREQEELGSKKIIDPRCTRFQKPLAKQT